jgi:ATP-binding cassette subfamily B multidrug efflux pump
MRSLIDFWRNEKLNLALIVILTIITTLVTLLFPYILKDIIDGIKTNFARQDLLKFVFILGGIGCARAVLNAVLPFNRGRMNERFLLKERTNVFSALLHKGHSFTNAFPAGDILQRLDHDLNEFCWFACSGIFRPVEGVITILIAVVFLVKIDPWLTLLSVFPMSLAAFGWLKISPIMYKYYYAWREAIAQVNTHIQSSFSGIKLVKSYTIEDQSHRQFNDILRARIHAAVKVIRIEAFTDTLFTSIEEIGIILILIFGSIFVIKGNLTIGEFVAFNAYIILLLDPMIRIGNFFVSKKRAQVQNERVEEIKSYPVDIQNTGTQHAATDHAISADRISFRYSDKSPFVLDGISIHIPTGRKIGIAGTVGSGKTTLMKLLMRIADSTEGTLQIGDINLRTMELASVRKLFGYIPQDPVLFSDTLYNNIVLGREFSPSRIDEALELARLTDFVKRAPKGLSTMIGERGLQLSGGEKQRVAIARAVIDQPKILIFDDATSNLDAETEKELITGLSRAVDATIVIISHRLSILSICDHIYVVDKGKIVEQGTHRSLLRKHGLYWKLYKYQIA